MLKPGDVVGPYEIRGFVGQGGMGRVYRAFDPRLERTIALKVIVVPTPSATTSAADSARLTSEVTSRLLREARAVASLSHPNVVGIYDVGESEGRLYLAMEYVVGTTLRSLVGATDVPLSRRLRWLVDIARALHAAHTVGLVHRDVKPENVMVREDGVVKVLDFGIARRTVSPTADDQQAIDTVTGQGAIAGTPVYMAPEQIKGSEVDARCDQFAWGVMAYELIAGARPWADSGDLLALVAKVLTEQPASLRERNQDIPAAVEETVMRALAKDPKARFASMADVADALEPFATQSTGGGERVRIAPRRDDPTAFAATTRVPTSVSIAPMPKDAGGPPAKNPKARIWSLVVPIALTGVLAGAVVLARRAHPTPIPAGAPRPLSTVPEAEAAFKEARNLLHDGVDSKGRAAMARAVDLDPTFAAAHLEIAIQTQQEDPGAAQAAFQSAFEHREMLLPRDAALLDASEPYIRAKPDLDEWETRMTSVVFQFPRDPELQLFLGRARERQGDDEGAKAAYEAAVRLDASYVPAIAALAGAERNLGHVTEALAATERCTKLSPVASTCVEARYRLLAELGECHRAREEASQWRTLEPQSPKASATFARALYADGAPRPSVEEALGRAWSLLPDTKRTTGELRDRIFLAIDAGELGKAADLAREYDEKLPASADQIDHAMPARVRMNLLIESDDLPGAAKVAHGYLDRMDAWQVYPFATDPAIAFYEPLYRTGEITKEELSERRARWIERERKRLPGSDHESTRASWSTWMSVWGGFSETREEAVDAVAHMPNNAPLPSARRGAQLDFTMGKVYALAGRPNEAISHLLRVTNTCSDEPMLVLRARWYLGNAYEAKGDTALAREAYQRVVMTWPATAKSRTMRAAAKRLEALGR
ncbi:serine/threonine protein kinase [Labilithrix luteola]|uniref:Serine/threonine protein kinase n=1 Tax=Labilithrix luteola TaxID=1391654 RepID=A0A0K1Q6P4_9BACT|nr:serine/threonine-protein kinase [Labilithrix luteola]AKV01506.1 serine/threonine protein kinase [Labilithrix luteola]